jgi:hypothetical protein
VIKALLLGAAAASLVGLAARAGEPLAWVVTPAAEACHAELELTGASGAITSVTLVSDGDAVQLVFPRSDAPERAFLPIRIDHKPFPNLVLRQSDGKSAAMQLSPETLAALGKGRALQIGWLTDEPVQAPLTGSEQALADLRTCGAQVAHRFRDQQAAERDAQTRADAEARAQALASEQLAAVRAQKKAAEAEARRNAADAERLQAEAARQRAEAEAAREENDQQEQAGPYPYAQARGYAPDPRAAYDPRDPYAAYGYPPPYRGW